MEYAFEGDELSGEGEPSVFTSAVVKALATGEADRDQDNWISVRELYDYVCDQVRELTPNQRPNMLSHLEGELYIARSRYVAPVRPARLPGELVEALENPVAPVRAGAVTALAGLLSSSDPALVQAARLRLERLAESVPQTAVVAGALSITNNGNHGGTPIIDATGSQVIVRCGDPAGDKTCANFESGQIKPGTPQADATAPNLMSPEQLQRFKQRAIMDGNYYPGCPTDPYDLSGKVDDRVRAAEAEGARPRLREHVRHARSADLALRAGRHGRRLDVPRDPLRRQQLRQDLRREHARARRRHLQQAEQHRRRP
jgi:hypothetical protein